jgi:hypothetical protein
MDCVSFLTARAVPTHTNRFSIRRQEVVPRSVNVAVNHDLATWARVRLLATERRVQATIAACFLSPRLVALDHVPPGVPRRRRLQTLPEQVVAPSRLWILVQITTRTYDLFRLFCPSIEILLVSRYY